MSDISDYLKEWINGGRKSWKNYPEYIDKYSKCHKLFEKDIPSPSEFIEKVLNLLPETAKSRHNSKEIIETVFSQKIITPRTGGVQSKGSYTKIQRLKEDEKSIKLLRDYLEISENDAKKVQDYLEILSSKIIELLRIPFSATSSLPYMVFSGNKYIKILNLLDSIKNNNTVELKKYRNYSKKQLEKNPELYTDANSFFHLNTLIFELYGIFNLHKVGVYIYNSCVDLEAFGYKIVKPQKFADLFNLFKEYDKFIKEKYRDSIIDSDPRYQNLRDMLPEDLTDEQKGIILRHIEVDQFFYSYFKTNKEEENGTSGSDASNASNKEQEAGQRAYEKIPRNLILHGPVGTGKTYIARILANYIAKGQISDLSGIEVLLNKNIDPDNLTLYPIDDDTFQMVTFHQSYGYEEFIGGITADTDGDAIKYHPKEGIFMKLCKQAKEHMDRPYVILIDEINRGDISRIFGELITLIEEDKRYVNEGSPGISLTVPNFDKFTVPNNVFIIGTMNDSDRSIALLDVALRRRFIFFNIKPDSKVLERWIKDEELESKVEKALIELNKKIEKEKDADSQIGHAFFKSLENADDEKKELTYIFKYKIFPLLSEIFYSQDHVLKVLIPDKFNIKNLNVNNIEDYLNELKKLGDSGETGQ